MRLSSDKDDPGYEAWVKAGRRARVWLDGVEQEHCVVADDAEGLVVRHKLDEQGRRVLDRAKNQVVTEEVRGVVHIERSRSR